MLEIPKKKAEARQEPYEQEKQKNPWNSFTFCVFHFSGKPSRKRHPQATQSVGGGGGVGDAAAIVADSGYSPQPQQSHSLSCNRPERHLSLSPPPPVLLSLSLSPPPPSPTAKTQNQNKKNRSKTERKQGLKWKPDTETEIERTRDKELAWSLKLDFCRQKETQWKSLSFGERQRHRVCLIFEAWILHREIEEKSLI